MNAATGTIRRLTLVAACLGLLTLTPTQRAEAADSNPSSNGTAQVQWCESMGGTATVGEGRSVGGGLESVSVSCSGGLGGSWNCHNVGNTADCQASRGRLPDWGDLGSSLGTGDQVLEDVAGTQTPAPVVTTPLEGPVAIADDASSLPASDLTDSTIAVDQDAAPIEAEAAIEPVAEPVTEPVVTEAVVAEEAAPVTEQP